MNNANLVIREDFSMPQNLEAITSKPLQLDLKDRNTSENILFVNADKTNKGSNSIQVANGTTTFIKMISTDTTTANIIAIISNV